MNINNILRNKILTNLFIYYIGIILIFKIKIKKIY